MQTAFIEIRGAAGGDEAKIWATELIRMYSRFALKQNWKITQLADGVLKIKGEKVYISAGMHQLTDNILYFVMAKVQESSSTFGLSCFIVPQYCINSDGSRGKSNHVTCKAVVDKMGFNGCANTHLLYGDSGDCYGYLLGDRENIGLIQMMTLMNQARLSTGVFAMAIASSAYLNALHYANQRIQGKRFHETFNRDAPQVPIIEHNDVQRMLMEMKAKVEGMRALIMRVAYYDSIGKTELVDLLTPIVKAHVSDEAWRVCELAIQTLGGIGYTKLHAVEQYARDVKVLSIWEGTNYIQSQNLIRDKLAMGRSSKFYKTYLEEAEAIFLRCNDAALKKERQAVQHSLKLLSQTLNLFGSLVKKGKMKQIPTYSTLFLKMMGHITLALYHLDMAAVSLRKLDQEPDFYQAKLASCRYYIHVILPETQHHHHLIATEAIDLAPTSVFQSDLQS